MKSDATNKVSHQPFSADIGFKLPAALVIMSLLLLALREFGNCNMHGDSGVPCCGSKSAYGTHTLSTFG